MIQQPKHLSQQVDFAGWSQCGPVRQRNADEMLIVDPMQDGSMRGSSVDLKPVSGIGLPESQLFAVADGIGSDPGSQRASRIVTDRLSHYAKKRLLRPWSLNSDEQPVRDVVATLQRCQRQMVSEVEQCGDVRRMGTTVTAACILWPTLHVVHAGDSRCYLSRGDKLVQLTTDHTLAQQMVDSDLMTAEAATGSRWRNVLSNAVTSELPEWEAETTSLELESGDTLLLCTDGLNKHVADPLIRTVLQQRRPAVDMARQLVELALADGGTDNVTVVVVKFLKSHLT